MTPEERKPVIEQVMDDEVRRDLGRTPTYPIDETQVVRNLETPMPTPAIFEHSQHPMRPNQLTGMLQRVKTALGTTEGDAVKSETELRRADGMRSRQIAGYLSGEDRQRKRVHQKGRPGSGRSP
jgi:hypothetical protein